MFNMASHIIVTHTEKSAAKYTPAKQKCSINHSHVLCNKEIKLTQTTKADKIFGELSSQNMPSQGTWKR